MSFYRFNFFQKTFSNVIRLCC